MERVFLRGLALGVLVSLAGCMVGPQYEKPVTPGIVLASEQAARFDAPETVLPAQWWTFFDDPGLVQWVDAAMAHNHDIRQAQASLYAARAVFDERRLDRQPGLTSRAGYERGIQQQMGADGEPGRALSESWRAGFDMQWEIDLFGRLERLQQAALARADAAQAELALMRLSIASEVARTYFEAQGLQRQLAVTRQEVANWDETVRLTSAMVRAGSGLPEDQENAQSQRLRSEAALAPLTVALQEAYYRLDVLAGKPPGQGLAAPGERRTGFVVTQLPLGDVDALIRQRPDVMQAELQLAASVEDVGAATAELYPRLDLGGFIGFFALRDGDLGSASRAFQIAPGVSWPALRLGNARARLRGAEAVSEGAQARYEQVLLQAQEEVENAVTRLAENQRRMAVLLQAAGHAEAAFDIADRRYRAGAGAYLAVLENQRALFQARQAIAEAETASFVDVVAVYKALGWGVEEML
ncbi:efflux transporter outer membrane subunit [Kerstersia similis]|uniref:efflux transporter outer membrane subunit n=1 Tax=Kerstersia similis TaxID=206505 RepID=UPI0039EF446C